MAYQHGVVSGAGSYGLIQKFTSRNNAEKAEARDANGDVAAFVHYNETIEITVDYVQESSLSEPSPGDSITITGGLGAGSYTVDSVEQVESNTEYMTLSITATRYVTNSLPT